MVVCLIALVVFGILGIFSATHRELAKEAFECVFNRATLKPCTSGFDKKMKSQITGRVLKKSPTAGKFVYRHFEAISWAFTILIVVSMLLSAQGIYNYTIYGSCEPHSTTCIFNPGELSCGSQHCTENGCSCETEGCEAPNFAACEENCDCKDFVCG